jgi:hypothetical protein
MPVAKSYTALTIEEGPYEVSGRMYCKVRMKSGALKQVRWYTDKEYAKMYPGESAPTSTVNRKTQRDILGFEKGYITIFKGNVSANEEWFKKSIARYCRFWGWYVVSTDDLPIDLPYDVVPVQLNWELVGDANGTLLSETQVMKAIEPLLYEASVSEYQGEIGERLEADVVVTKSVRVEGRYGMGTFHVMEDQSGNVYVWTTSARSWSEGSQKHIRGTVKDHRLYHNTKQTILTRVVEA